MRRGPPSARSWPKRTRTRRTSPRGIVLGPGGDDLFVGNFTTAEGKSHGSLLRYDLASGALLSNDKAKGFKNHDFHPRGVVFGPDGMLYVASPMNLQTGLGGAVLRFNADGTFADVFINDENDAGAFGHLNRPDGIVFGPDGNLYVTSFRPRRETRTASASTIRPGTSSGRSTTMIRLPSRESPPRRSCSARTASSLSR